MPPACHALFITGTDTGCGKTLVTTALALALRGEGVDVGVMKPVATGLVDSPAGPISPDVAFYLKFLEPGDEAEVINPVRYREPLAPSVAARTVHRPVDLLAIRGAYATLSERHAWLLVEGIGGALTPLSDTLTVADLIAAMKLPALVVARAGLGTLNHTLLTIEALHRRDVPVEGIILCPTSRHPDLAEKYNPEELQLQTGLYPDLVPGVPGVNVELLEGDGLSAIENALRPLARRLIGQAG